MSENAVFVFKLIFFVLFIGLPVLAVFMWYRKAMKPWGLWEAFASKRGLRFDNADGKYVNPIVHGTVKNRPVLLGTFSSRRKSGERGSPFTLVEVGLLSELPKELSVSPKGDRSLPLVEKAFHVGSIQTGDTTFDRDAVVHGGDPSFVRTYLTESKRAAILQIVKDGMRINKKSLQFTSVRQIVSEEKMEQLYRKVLDAAQQLDAI